MGNYKSIVEDAKAKRTPEQLEISKVITGRNTKSRLQEIKLHILIQQRKKVQNQNYVDNLLRKLCQNN